MAILLLRQDPATGLPAAQPEVKSPPRSHLETPPKSSHKRYSESAQAEALSESYCIPK